MNNKMLGKDFGRRIFEFQDPTLFLRSYVDLARKSERAFTVSRFARQLELKDPTSINKILRGHRHPGPVIAGRLAAYFSFDSREARYFTDILDFAKAKGDARRTGEIIDRLKVSGGPKKFRLIDLDEFDSIARWHCFGIQQMTKMAGSPRSTAFVDWAFKLLRVQITKTDIRDALRLLRKSNLVIEDEATGCLRPGTPRYRTPTEVASEAIKRFHEGTIDLARNAVRSVPIAERSIVGSTMCIKRERLGEAKKLIEVFQNEMAALIECDGGDAVYQLNVQLFPLTIRSDV